MEGCTVPETGMTNIFCFVFEAHIALLHGKNSNHEPIMIHIVN